MKKPLNIVADAHIWQAKAAFSRLPGFAVRLRLLENSEITRAALRHADILLTRSATRVNAELLEETAVRFAATATIGDDHYDKAWLDAEGIGWANAAGSSAGSVVEYMLTVLLELHARKRISIPATTIGIIGAGRIGGALAEICRDIGMRVMINDPPRQRREGDAGFSPLTELLAEADVLSLHTPLINEGIDCSRHLLAAGQLAAFEGCGIINAGRGSCLDNAVLPDWLAGHDERFAVLDCWEHEPVPSQELIGHAGVAIATPHIAGHSLDGKAANTRFVYNALCGFLGIEPEWEIHRHLPAPAAPLEIDAAGDPWPVLHKAASALCPIAADDAAMRSWSDMSSPELAEAFTGYRRHYPVRRAWGCAPLHLHSAGETTVKLARALGMKIV